MLRRSDPPPESSKEQTEARDRPVRTVIVIGASAGGRAAIGTVLKDLSRDIPAAIVVMLHVSPESVFDLSKWLRQFGHIQIVETSRKESPSARGLSLWHLPVNRLPFKMAN